MSAEDVLSKVELFSELPRRDLARLGRLAVSRTYKAGEIIVREGEAGVAFYVIASGRVEVVKDLGTPNERVLAALGTNSYFGEMALFDNDRRSASVRAVDDTECLMITRWDFNAELTTSPRLATSLLSILARRVRSLNEAVTH